MMCCGRVVGRAELALNTKRDELRAIFVQRIEIVMSAGYQRSHPLGRLKDRTGQEYNLVILKRSKI